MSGGGVEGEGHPHPPLLTLPLALTSGLSSVPCTGWTAVRQYQEDQRGWRVTPGEALSVPRAHCSISDQLVPWPSALGSQENLTWMWGESVGGVPPSSQMVLPADRP